MKQEEILFFLGSACIVVLAWIAFTVLHNSLTSTIGASQLQAITPIDASFNVKVLNNLKKRTVVEPIFIIQPQVPTDIVVTSSPSQTPTPSPFGNVASQGGTLQ